MLVLTVVDEINKDIELCIGYLEGLSHGGEHVVCVTFLIVAEFHQTQEQQGSFLMRDLGFQFLADRVNSRLRIRSHIVGHLIDVPQITIESEIGFDVPNSEIATHIVFQHGSCPCLVNLFFLAK